MLDPFTLPFVQHGLWAILLLAIGAGVLGTWIVLRGLAFYAHGVAAATFPGLVLADGLGFAAPLGALAMALLFAVAVGRLATRQGGDHSTMTAMVLVGALAAGVILASDVFDAAANVNGLLFGSLLVISDRDLMIAGAASAVVLVATLLLGPRWLALGFDRDGARALGVRAGGPDAVLLVLVALVAVATLSAVGALLAAALMVIPAATVRPWISRMPIWQLATTLVTAALGAAGLWLSVKTNAPPGATIAVLAGVLFLMSVTLHSVLHRRSDRPRGGGGGRRRLAGRPALLVLLGLIGAGVAGCGSSDSGAKGDRIAVVATTTQLGDIVREVGGDRIALHQILQPNTDPHEYEPRPKDVQETAGAKLVFASGDGLDGWAGDIVEQSGSKATTVTVGAKVPTRLPGGEGEHEHGDHEDEAGGDHDEQAGHDEAGHEEAGHDHGGGAVDPHWWHDPRNVAAAVTVIRDALVAAEPDATAAIDARATAYLKKVEALDAGIARCIREVPAAQRKLVTSHDAFGYFTHRYGIRVVGAVIPSQTTQAQPSAGDVAKLADLVKREKVKAVFPESSVNPKLADAMARQTGAVSNLTLYGDTLGPAGSDGATYLGMEQHNADAMVRGFTGGAVRCRVAGL
ncbi:putative ABC transporter [Patulibacter medicamentivorans]|uniref:Putative ABC transporter n=1 Tax=Patulibacter medicamentivorans TaxID=1097667 RepID=H0E474_9ACTN|nr:zinc ABC transporter substrate-binding protein [Patulibacter medicamentivorans]EHN11516.1 putative ABC transporter [Patulibacter medicamentivorans]